MRLLARLRGDRGATAVEYAILITGIAAVIITAVALLGTTVTGLFERVDWPVIGS